MNHKLIFINISIIIFSLVILGSAAAADNISNNSIQSLSTNLTISSLNSSVNNSSNNSTYENSSNINSTTVKSSLAVNETGCCSVLLHVKDGVDVFAYRRDSTYAADLYMVTVNWYGKKAIKEYKTVNGYFFHTIITDNGWIVSAGGPDVVWINKKLESIAGDMSLKGKISKTSMEQVSSLIKKIGMGHFLIKDPKGNVGLVTYNSGLLTLKIFKMKDGSYVSVPNSPKFYREGSFTSDSVSAAIYLAGTDRWGVNRRNIITYQVENIGGSAKIKIWASFDGGKLIGTNKGYQDNIIFMGHKISAKSLPRIPSKKYIGSVTFSTAPTVKAVDPANNAVNVALDKVIKVTFSESIKAGNGWIELVTSNGTVVPSIWSINGNVLTVTPNSTLTRGVNYLLLVHTGSVTDLDGNKVAGYVSRFTGDTVAPAVKTVDPANNAVNIAADKVIKVTFNESIQAGNGWIDLW
ncbi:MAG: Ig-like domain-containing protein [Methanobacterium paludis]|nr:Ig-like domain-containing protein [Methanobacterium paludis]